MSMLCGILSYEKLGKKHSVLIGVCRYISFAITLRFLTYTKHLSIHNAYFICVCLGEQLMPKPQHYLVVVGILDTT